MLLHFTVTISARKMNAEVTIIHMLYIIKVSAIFNMPASTFMHNIDIFFIHYCEPNASA